MKKLIDIIGINNMIGSKSNNPPLGDWYENIVINLLLNLMEGLSTEYTFEPQKESFQDELRAFFYLTKEFELPIAVVASKPPGQGTHWVLFYFIDENNLLYIDPYGHSNDNVIKAMEGLGKNLYISTSEFQTDGMSCGPISVNLAVNLHKSFFANPEGLINYLNENRTGSRSNVFNVDISGVLSEEELERTREPYTHQLRAEHHGALANASTKEVTVRVSTPRGVVERKEKQYDSGDLDLATLAKDLATIFGKARHLSVTDMGMDLALSHTHQPDPNSTIGIFNRLREKVNTWKKKYKIPIRDLYDTDPGKAFADSFEAYVKKEKQRLLIFARELYTTMLEKLESDPGAGNGGLDEYKEKLREALNGIETELRQTPADQEVRSITGGQTQSLVPLSQEGPQRVADENRISGRTLSITGRETQPSYAVDKVNHDRRKFFVASGSFFVLSAASCAMFFIEKIHNNIKWVKNLSVASAAVSIIALVITSMFACRASDPQKNISDVSSVVRMNNVDRLH